MMNLSALSGLSFAHPVPGLLGLLGVVAVVAIHFLQRPSRPVVVSTLFLLDHLQLQSRDGSRLQRFRQSVPFWLQLAGALLLAWLLAGPRWLRSDSAQSVLVILDSSVSMRPFKESIRLAERLRPLEKSAARTEWIVVETDPAARRLYAGSSLDEAAAALARWEPKLGTHDFAPALRLARTAAGQQANVLFITDRPTPVPPGVELLAVGEPIGNIGFCGARVVRGSSDGSAQWEALIRNYGTAAREGEWWVETEAPEGQPMQRTAPQRLTLAPGESRVVRGPFPANAIRLVLAAVDGGERFDLDAALPLVRPEPKPFRFSIQLSEEPLRGWLAALLNAEPGFLPEPEQPDLRLAAYNPLAPALPEGPAIVFLRHPPADNTLYKGMIVAERHPLTDGLQWAGLLAARGPAIPRKPGDDVLLWQGDHPLILQRGKQLLVNFDPARSNAMRLPAFLVLLHRFMETLRSDLPGLESANFELHQRLHVATENGAPLRRLPGSPDEKAEQTEQAEQAKAAQPTSSPLRAPALPGFFTVREESGALRLIGAAAFADPREADFRDAATLDPVASMARLQRERQTREEALAPLWLLLFGAAAATAWAWQERRGTR